MLLIYSKRHCLYLFLSVAKKKYYKQCPLTQTLLRKFVVGPAELKTKSKPKTKGQKTIMAIYSFQCKIIARTQRLNNAVGHAAYINRQDYDNSKDGSKWRYSHKASDVYASGVVLPDHADEKFSDPSYLWNEVEEKENRSNSRLARSFIIALPNELTPEQNKNLIEDYIKNHMSSAGMIVNYAIHIDDLNNFHAHLMSTTRELDASGLAFAKKNVIGRTWNDEQFLEGLRKGWADTANTHLAKLDHQARIDHRTLSAQRDEALEQYEQATTAEAKAEALARAVALDRNPIQRIQRSKLQTEEGRALRESQQQLRDEQLAIAEETRKSVLSLPQEIVLNDFKAVVAPAPAPKKIKSHRHGKAVATAKSPAPVAVVKTVKSGDVVFNIRSVFEKALINFKKKRAEKRIKKLIAKIDRENHGQSVYHDASRYFEVKPVSEKDEKELSPDELALNKLQKYWRDIDRRGKEIEQRKSLNVVADKSDRDFENQYRVESTVLKGRPPDNKAKLK